MLFGVVDDRSGVALRAASQREHTGGKPLPLVVSCAPMYGVPTDIPSSPGRACVTTGARCQVVNVARIFAGCHRLRTASSTSTPFVRLSDPSNDIGPNALCLLARMHGPVTTWRSRGAGPRPQDVPAARALADSLVPEGCCWTSGGTPSVGRAGLVLCRIVDL